MEKQTHYYYHYKHKYSFVHIRAYTYILLSSVIEENFPLNTIYGWLGSIDMTQIKGFSVKATKEFALQIITYYVYTNESIKYSIRKRTLQHKTFCTRKVAFSQFLKYIRRSLGQNCDFGQNLRCIGLLLGF